MKSTLLRIMVAALSMLFAGRLLAVEPNPSAISETNSQDLVRAYLQLQEELHATQLELEQNRTEARETARQNADALASRLQNIEQALGSQRARELEAIQSTNRVMVIVAGGFASLGFIALLLMAYFQWRTVHGLAEISAALPGMRALGPGGPLAALGPGEAQVMGESQAEKSNLRLLGAMEQLEKRIYELEHTASPPAHGSNNGPGAPSGSNGGPESAVTEPESAGEATRISLLLAKGQSMLNLDNPQAALACFDEVLNLAPEHTEALVKKGAALERLQKLDDAIQCYDRAIAADDSMTIAYLHKGGLFNRMERFKEALECYEKALQTQEKKQA